MWYKSFKNLFENIKSTTNIEETILLESFRNLHKKYHSSEASFIIDELDCLNHDQICLLKDENHYVEGEFSLLHKYNHLKKHSLKLCAGVERFFEQASSKNITVAAFTESNLFFTKMRLVHLNLDGKIKTIYAPRDFELPDSVVKNIAILTGNLKKTKYKELSQTDKKTNKKILLDIITSEGFDKSEALYIGDKLQRDIIMANQAEIRSAHAVYGDNVDNSYYELLRKVSHWSDDEIEQEKLIQQSLGDYIAKPDFILNNGLDEIFNFIC